MIPRECSFIASTAIASNCIGRNGYAVGEIPLLIAVVKCNHASGYNDRKRKRRWTKRTMLVHLPNRFVLPCP